MRVVKGGGASGGRGKEGARETQKRVSTWARVGSDICTTHIPSARENGAQGEEDERRRPGWRDGIVSLLRLSSVAETYWLISKEGPAQTAMKAHLDHVLSEGGDGRVSRLTPLYDPSSSSVLSLSMNPILVECEVGGCARRAIERDREDKREGSARTREQAPSDAHNLQSGFRLSVSDRHRRCSRMFGSIPQLFGSWRGLGRDADPGKIRTWTFSQVSIDIEDHVAHTTGLF